MIEPVVLNGDCLALLRSMRDSSVDAVVTDPPYGLSNTDPKHVAETITRWVNGDRDYLPGGAGFMGKAWDAFVPPVAVWDECLRVLKPGGHVLTFAGSRTMDLMTLGLRLAGFDIRDSIAWLYGSGFPKSLDVSKAIDKAAGAERAPKTVRSAASAYSANAGNTRPWMENDGTVEVAGDTPATPDAQQWAGWGTALKPAFEPIIVARKPLVGTVAANVLQHGTGALNIDGCRVATTDNLAAAGGEREMNNAVYGKGLGVTSGRSAELGGRWPANVVLDESQVAELDRQSGTLKSGKPGVKRKGNDGPAYGAESRPPGTQMRGHGDSGGASRFFYVAKAPKRERPVIEHDDGTRTAHATVKPLALMQWLVRLVTPPGGIVLDPFAGSGTTGEAALLEGFEVWLIEREDEYLPLIHTRVDRVLLVAEDTDSPSTEGPLDTITCSACYRRHLEDASCLL